MNSLKTVFVMAVLAAVAYGAYVAINRNTETTPLGEGAPSWSYPPTAQISQQPNAPAVTFPNPTGEPITPVDATAMEAYSPSPANVNGVPTTTVDPHAAHRSASPYAAAPADGAPAPAAALGHTTATPYGSLGHPNVPDDLASPGTPPAAANPQSPPGRSEIAWPASSDSPLDSSAHPLRTDNGEKFANYLLAVQSKLDEGRLNEAHLALSTVYDNPDVPAETAQQALDLLDQLAGTVIYSRQHLLEGPYTIRAGDTIEQIAQTYNVPWQLLVRINSIRDPQNLPPGEELKVVRGPFSAVINLDRFELTLMLHGRYAGRFPIGIGSDQPNLEGSFVVRDKAVDPEYFGPGQINIRADDPNNPYGELLINLTTQTGEDTGIGIHGTNDPANIRRVGGPGSICMSGQDIDDVFGILSLGSRITIRK